MFIELYKLTDDQENRFEYINVDHISDIEPCCVESGYKSTIWFVNGKYCYSAKRTTEIRETLRECGVEVW